jgi:hypothetical protein
MRANRCAAGCQGCHGVSRREFVAAASATFASASLLGGWLSGGRTAWADPIKQQGPAATCVPAVKACFVRRKGDYGMRWPGKVYDGEAARRKYTDQITTAAKELGLKLDLAPAPLYTAAEADAWLAQAAQQKPDGLLVVLLDRQEHAWPTAGRAIDTKIPTVVFSPIGSSFTINTAAPSKKPGCMICSTDDFGEVRYGLKMLKAGAKMKATRCLVIAGDKEGDSEIRGLGIKLRTIPAKAFLDEYQKTPESEEVLKMAKDLIQGAKRLIRATEQDVIHGIKSYVVARTLLAREKADAITMDCLGALGHTKVSLPCIAWSKMNDDGIPAACEADLGAVATHVITQYLFDRPGFQQDPVGESAREAVIGAHCSCPTRLGGFGTPPEVYDIVHHHGVRDATARPVWKVGQRVTCADVLLEPAPAKPHKMVISAGTVLENVAVPPAGGCVISVMVKFDGTTDVLAYPGFHQLFFYGDYKRQLLQFCRMFGIEPMVA